jgi:hypothetical protein
VDSLCVAVFGGGGIGQTVATLNTTSWLPVTSGSTLSLTNPTNASLATRSAGARVRRIDIPADGTNTTRYYQVYAAAATLTIHCSPTTTTNGLDHDPSSFFCVCCLLVWFGLVWFGLNSLVQNAAGKLERNLTVVSYSAIRPSPSPSPSPSTLPSSSDDGKTIALAVVPPLPHPSPYPPSHPSVHHHHRHPSCVWGGEHIT